jgi:chromate transporter
MEKGWKLYWRLFVSTFLLSAFTFGGGYVIVPLMRKKFSEQYKWIEEKEMLDLVAIAQSAPGPIAVNASILVGYRISGLPGAVFTILGTILPPLIILSVISFFYAAFKQSAAVNAILRGMNAGVAAVIVDVVVKMCQNIISERSAFSIVLMIASFAAAFLFDVDVKLIILAGALLGLCSAFILHRKKKEEHNHDPS